MSPCIANGRCGEDKNIGKFTSTDNTVIDYMISSPLILSRVKRFCVHDFDCLFSDKHCTVEMVLRRRHRVHKGEPVTQLATTQDPVNNDEPQIGKWMKEKQDNYIENIQLSDLEHLLTNWDMLTVDEITDELSRILTDSARITFPRRLKKGNKKVVDKKSAWFNPECRLK